MLRLSLFGFPTVSLDGVLVTDFISQKVLVLLCYLALEPRVHARETLAGLFWSDLPQERALSNLRQALHNLQKQVPGYIVVTRQTVWFDATRPYSCDTTVLDSDDGVGEDLLTVYRDGFMAGVFIADESEIAGWMSHTRERYSLRYADRLETLLGAVFARRDMRMAEQVARCLIAHDPFREAAYRILWRVLVQQGNVAQAVSSIEALWTLLRREFDITPAPETQLMAEQIALLPVRVPHNFPTFSSPLVGYSAELSRLRELLGQAECRLVTLCGIGGGGKSRLAAAFGQADAGYYLHGVAFIPLAMLTDAVYLDAALAEALGYSLQNVSEPQREIAAHLAVREMLLIFDNAEHLAGFPLWLSKLLQSAPYVRAVVTSRQRLHLREEWVVTLEGLPYGISAQTPSMDLLVQSASRAGRLIARDRDAVDLCALLEGLPLGIELAGALLANCSTSELLHAVQANLDHLQAPWVNTDPHHRSLRAVFETTWGMLSREERDALADLAVFATTFTGHAAQAVAGAGDAVLDRLATRSLVRNDDGRWSMHAAIRAYAREKQTAPKALAARFTTYVSALLAQAEEAFTARKVRAAVDTMHAEIGCLRQLWQTAVDQRQVSLLIRLSFTMHRYYEGTGLFAEGLTLFRKSLEVLALDRFSSDERELLGRLKTHKAGILLRLGNASEALSSAQDAVQCLSQDENDPAMLAFALNSCGIAQLYVGDISAARRTLEQCAEIYRQLEMPELIKPLVNLGALYSRTGEIDDAGAVLKEAHDIARRIGDLVGGFHIANSLGVNHMLKDDYAAAQDYFDEALELSEAAGFLPGKVMVLNNLGDVHTLRGQPQRGTEYAEEGISLARQLEDRRALAYCLTTAALARMPYQMLQAAAAIQEAFQLACEMESAPLLTTVAYAAGEWFAVQNRPAEAHRLWSAVSQHPVTEMDYRRRADRRLEAAMHSRPIPSDGFCAVRCDVTVALFDNSASDEGGGAVRRASEALSDLAAQALAMLDSPACGGVLSVTDR